MRFDEADSTHVGGQVVHFFHAFRRLQAVVPPPQVQKLEFVRARLLIVGRLDVHAAHPVTRARQALHQMMSDEAAGASDQDSLHCQALFIKEPVRLACPEPGTRSSSSTNGPYTEWRSNVCNAKRRARSRYSLESTAPRWRRRIWSARAASSPAGTVIPPALCSIRRAVSLPTGQAAMIIAPA